MKKKPVWFGASLSLLISILTYWIWFFRWDIYSWGDWGFYFPETVRDFITLPQVWNNNFLGGIDISLPLYPLVRLGLGLLSNIVQPFQALHLIYFLPSLVLSSLGGFFLIRYVYKSDLAGFVGSMAMSFNTYFMIIRGGHLTLVDAFSLAPFALLAFLHGLYTSKFRWFVASGVLASLSVAYEVRAAYILFGLIVGLLLLHLPFVSIRTICKSIVTFIVGGLLNAYWLIGLFFSGGGTSNLPIFHRALYGEGYSHLVRSAVIQLYQWSPSGQIGSGIQDTPWISWLMPLIAFCGLYLGRRNKLVVFFGWVALVGIFFSKMSGQPFPQVYQWMFEHFPGFSIFREPSKFFFLTVLGYAVLLGGFAKLVWANYHQKKRAILTIIFMCGLFVANGRNVVNGTLGELLKSRHIPHDYLVLKDFILSQPEFFRTLYLPVGSRWGIWTDRHPMLGAVTQAQSDWYKLNVYSKSGLEYSYLGEVTNLFTKSFFPKLLDMSSVKYVIVPTQDTSNNDDFFQIYGSRSDYLDIATSQAYLRPLDIKTEQLKVFENPSYLPLFYLTDAIADIHNATQSYEMVQYLSPSVSEYKIQIPAHSGIKYLNFSQSYHSGWALSPQSISWINLLLKKQSLLPPDDHFQNTALLNTFKINPSDHNQILYLYFVPQAYLNLGLSVTLIGLAVTITIIFIYKRKSKNEL